MLGKTITVPQFYNLISGVLRIRLLHLPPAKSTSQWHVDFPLLCASFGAYPDRINVPTFFQRANGAAVGLILARADAFANNPFPPSHQRQGAGDYVRKTAPIQPPAPVPTGPAILEAFSRFAHRDIAHVGGVGLHGFEASLGQVLDDLDRERDIFHVEIQCTFDTPPKFDDTDPYDNYNHMLSAQAP